MRIIANFHKGDALRFTSHLDVQRLLQRAMRRAELPIAYSQGFNPHPLLSCACALSVGDTSDGEWLDVRLMEDVEPEAFRTRLNETLPEGLRILRAMEAAESMPALTALLKGACYEVAFFPDTPVDRGFIEAAVKKLLQGEIIVNKRTKSGMKLTDIRDQVRSVSIEEVAPERILFSMEGECNASGGLKAALLMQAIKDALSVAGPILIHRRSVQFDQIEG